ncbi:MAG: hypothetical protein ACO4CW_08875, partial [Planctomycetota bacterium]
LPGTMGAPTRHALAGGLAALLVLLAAGCGATPVAAPAPDGAPAGRGTQVDPSTAEAESAGDDGTAEEPESMGDPIEALARYFEDFAAQGELDRSEDEASFGISPGEAEASEAEAARSIRRVHRIIIDLTGTIRG